MTRVGFCSGDEVLDVRGGADGKVVMRPAVIPAMAVSSPSLPRTSCTCALCPRDEEMKDVGLLVRDRRPRWLRVGLRPGCAAERNKSPRSKEGRMSLSGTDVDIAIGLLVRAVLGVLRALLAIAEQLFRLLRETA